LGRLVTVSAKVDEKLRKRARRLGVNISEVVRKAPEKELVKVFEEEVFRDVEELEKSGFKISHDGLNRLLDEGEEPVIYRHGRYLIICL
jgi:predicted nucleic acid-binding protein